MIETFSQQLLNALALGGVYALLAIGLAVIFSVLGMINFAHGEIMTVTGYVLVFAGAALGGPTAMVFVAAICMAVLFAVLTDRIAFRPIRNASLTTMLLATYALSTIIQVLFQNVISPRPVAVGMPGWLTSVVQIGWLRLGMLQLVSILVVGASLVGLTLFLRRSSLGIAMRAAAQDFQTTRLMGISADRVILAAFAISGLLAGIAGVLWVAQRGSVDPLMGFLPVLKAFIAVVLGGLGSLSGAVLGGFILGAIEVGLRATLPPDILPFRDAIALGIVIGILLIRPNGLLGAPEAVR